MSTALPGVSLVGIGPLLRLGLRRDRLMVAAWLLVLLTLCAASALGTSSLYATDAERVAAADGINASPGIVALYGPILDVHSLGELAMTKMTVLYAVLVMVMALLIVRRHTRVDEENGRTELLGGTAVGRHAQLGAAVALGSAVSLLLALLTALVNTLSGLPAVGSLAFGAAWGGCGLVAVGITAVACQLSASARTCAGIAVATIGVLFGLRAVGDTTKASLLSWVSPFGWNTRLSAYSETKWWILLLYVAIGSALVTVAYVLHARRDLGAGLIPARPGPAKGSPHLQDPVSVAIRLHFPMLLWWTVSVALLGLVFGAISPSFDGLDSDQVRELFERLGGAGTFRDMLLAAVASFIGLIVTCFGIAVMGHSAADEQAGRTEQVLASATPRARVFTANVLVAIAGSTWLLAVAGVGLALGVGNASVHSFGALAITSVVQAPAVWVVIALAALLLAFNIRWAFLGWVALVLFATLGQIGELLRLPDWVLELSPYVHVPKMPVEPFDSGSALALSAVAAVLIALAWTKFRTRDIG